MLDEEALEYENQRNEIEREPGVLHGSGMTYGTCLSILHLATDTNVQHAKTTISLNNILKSIHTFKFLRNKITTLSSSSNSSSSSNYNADGVYNIRLLCQCLTAMIKHSTTTGNNGESKQIILFALKCISCLLFSEEGASPHQNLNKYTIEKERNWPLWFLSLLFVIPKNSENLNYEEWREISWTVDNIIFELLLHQLDNNENQQDGENMFQQSLNQIINIYIVQNTLRRRGNGGKEQIMISVKGEHVLRTFLYGLLKRLDEKLNSLSIVDSLPNLQSIVLVGIYQLIVRYLYFYCGISHILTFFGCIFIFNTLGTC
jgi:hypothetical protein